MPEDSLDELTERLQSFAAARDWERFHTPKNLAMAVAAEAGELLAELQWSTPEESSALEGHALDRVTDEIADVMIYLTRLADLLGIDLVQAAFEKVEMNETRFPPTAS